MELSTHRPRNVGWARAAGLLYGDWGTSKAYVIGLAFVAAGFSSFPIILAVCALTGLVGYNYIIICRHFPDGGGVYSAAREQSRVLAVLGSLLLLADFIVTAAMSCWDAMSYFGVPREYLKLATIGFILLIGAINYFGPKHSGSFAVTLAVPMVDGGDRHHCVKRTALYVRSVPDDAGRWFDENWVGFVGVILALSGVEAIANLTGVMKLDAGSTPENPSVARTARKAILPVAIEVVFGTALLGWAMLSLPHGMGDTIKERYEDMLRFLGEHYGDDGFWRAFRPRVRSRYRPGRRPVAVERGEHGGRRDDRFDSTCWRATAKCRTLFTKLNSHGVPWQPLVVAVALPIVLVVTSENLDTLADMYAIGVVGAITVNLGSSCFNKRLGLNWREFVIMLVTFVILFVVEVTIAKTKPAALFFAACVLGVGFGLRWYAMKRAGFETVMLTRELAAAIVRPETAGQTFARISLPARPFSWPRAALRPCCDSLWRKRSCGREIYTCFTSNSSR